MTQQMTVREAREAHRPPLTQEQLADRAGVDQTYISLIERGLRKPSDDIKDRLAKALGIAPSALRFSDPGLDAEMVGEACDRCGHNHEESR